MLNHRTNTLLKASGTNVAFASGYKALVLPVGAVAVSSASGDITVRRGHSFKANDVGMIFTVGDATVIFTVDSVPDGTSLLHSNGTVSLSAGDYVVNLGPDTLTGGTVDFDASPMEVYSDPEGQTLLTNTAATAITASSLGNYDYYHRGDGMHWELILDSSDSPRQLVTGHGGGSRINVADFGVVRDGTTDVGARLASVLQSLDSTGKRVHLPPGTYDCTDSTLTIANPCIFSLERATVTLRGNEASADGLLITSSNVRIEGDGVSVFNQTRVASDGQSHIDYHAIRSLDSAGSLTDVHIDGIQVNVTVTSSGLGGGTSWRQAAIRLDVRTSPRTMVNSSVKNCKVTLTSDTTDTDHKMYGIYFYGFYGAGSNGRYIEGMEISGNTVLSTHGRNIQIYGVKRGVITNNRVLDVSPGVLEGANAIRCLHCQDMTIDSNVIQIGSDATDSGNGIYVAGSSGHTSNVRSEHIVISNNNLLNESTNNGLDGILIDGCRHVLITGNNIRTDAEETLQNGIDIQYSGADGLVCQDIVVSGNMLYGYGGVTASFCVFVESGSVRTVIIGNFMELKDTTGVDNIMDDNGTDSVVAGNVTSDKQASTQVTRLEAITGPEREYMEFGVLSEQVTLGTGSATTTTSGNLLPADSIIEAVMAIVTTSITTAVNFDLGDAATPARFKTDSTNITDNAKTIGLEHWEAAEVTAGDGALQTVAAPLVITCDTTPGAGAMYVTVIFRRFTAPTK